MAWNELKEFCNSLPQEQLERKVIFWREDEAIDDIEVGQLSEDYYIGEDDELCYTLSDMGLTVNDMDDNALGLKKAYSEGDAILWEHF